MSPSSRIPVLDRGSQLRLELKEWEHAFAAAHNGRKPSKAEVKADKVICTLHAFLLPTRRELVLTRGSGKVQGVPPHARRARKII